MKINQDGLTVEFPYEYRSYDHAKWRCESKKYDCYHRYGGRGIEFRFSCFREFLDAVGPRPKGSTLDRINKNGHYEPSNVKWSTPREQATNRDNRGRVSYQETLLVAYAKEVIASSK